MRLWSILVVAGLLLAGCAADPPAADTESDQIPHDWAERAVPWDGHDHHDPLQHQNLSTSNFELLGWDPLVSDHYGFTAGGHLCGDAVDNGEVRYGVVHGFGTDVAFVLVDITDPTQPTPVAEFIMERSSSRDVALSPDGRHVIVGLSIPDPLDENKLTSPLGPVGTWRTACGQIPVYGPEQGLPWFPGVMLVDISNPTAPVIADAYPLPALGAHSVYAGQLPDRQVVIVSVTNLVQTATSFYFFDIESTPAGSRLVPAGNYVEDPRAGDGALINGHNDGVVQVHPVTGQHLGYLANWDQGMVIVDASTPALLPVGRWSDNPGPGTAIQRDGLGSIHEAIPINTTWNDRHYTIVGQEIIAKPTNTPSGWVKILDTTDPSQPFEVAEWTLPVDVEWDASLVFSSHYLVVHGKTLFVAHYHAGVWAIDLSCVPECKHPPAIGAYVPANVSPAPPPKRAYDWTPTIMDVNVLPDGDLVIWDATSGVYMVRFDADNPAPPRVFEGYYE